MLGSPSFHSYRDANGGNGKSSVEMGSGLYYGDQSYSMGQSWSVRAPVRRALIPTKRTNTSYGRDFNNAVNPGKSLPNDTDDRIHNALLEELCADFGVNDSSDIDFLSFDIPTARIQSGQLPADLEELGEIVSFGTVRPKTESVHSVSRGIRQTSSSTSHLSLLGPGITTVKATSGMQMNIPDDVASPTISSSCEESKPADGGGEGLSDFPPNVHSTTGCVSVKPDIETSGSTEDDLQQPPEKTESVIENNFKQPTQPSTQIPEEQSCSEVVGQSKNQLDRDSSTASSPRHVAKKARVIASGGDLLEDVKKSYAFVCGADMFTPPAQPALSHPRLPTPVGSQFEPLPYAQNVQRYGMRASFTDGCENPLLCGVQNSGVCQPRVPDKSNDSVNFGNTTPVKGFRQNYYNEWQNLLASGLDRSYHPSIMHRSYMMGSGAGAVDTQVDGGQFMPGYYSGTGTGSDRSSVPYAGGGQYPRIADFPGHIDQNNLSCQSLNRSPRLAQAGSSYGYPLSSYGGPYQLAGRHGGPQQNELYHSPLHRNLPLHTSNAHLRHRPLTADDSGNAYPSRHLYPAQHTQPSNTNNASYNEQGDRSSAASPVYYRSRSVTPGFVPNYPFRSGMENDLQEGDSASRRYACHDLTAAAGRMTDYGLQQTPVTSKIQNGDNFPCVPTQNEFTYNQLNTCGDICADARGNFPRSPAVDRSVVKPVTPRSAVMPPDVEQSYGASSCLPMGQPLPGSCHSFVRHLIGSGSGPYRSHPLFPLLRDLVIADMNFEAPSFPYPLIAGLPKSFDRLISNYFSCTADNANSGNVDPSADAIVMDALRYAHSALLDKICRRQLKEGHHAVSPVDSVCSQISEIGQHGHKESRRSSWTDTSRSVASASQCISDQLGNTFLPPPVSGSIEQVLPSPGRSSRFQAADDSPGSNASYSLLTSPSSICRGHVPQHPGYVHAYNYGGDMSLGMEKVSRSKVLPNEAKAIMTEWLRNHQDNPYPNDDEKEALMQSTKLTINQINYWFTNARRRLLPKWSMIRRNAEEAKNSCSSPIMTT